MIFGILNEADNRIAIAPESIPKLEELGFKVTMVKDAGALAGFPDSDYTSKGVKIVTKAALLSKSDVIATFNPLSTADQGKCKDTAVLISRYTPY